MLKGSRAEFRSTARQPRRRADHLDAAGLARQPMVTRALRVRPCWLNRRNRSLPTDPWRRGPLDRSPSRFYLQWAISHSSLYTVLPRSERAPRRARGEPSGEAFGWLSDQAQSLVGRQAGCRCATQGQLCDVSPCRGWPERRRGAAECGAKQPARSGGTLRKASVHGPHGETACSSGSDHLLSPPWGQWIKATTVAWGISTAWWRWEALGPWRQGLSGAPGIGRRRRLPALPPPAPGR